MNTAEPPIAQLVRRPVLRKNTGITAISMLARRKSIFSWLNHSASITAPARKAPTMKCRPAQSAAKRKRPAR
jgi:hypothetical protein